MKHVHLQGTLPKRRLCLPQGCQVRLDFDEFPFSWDRKWQSKFGRILMACIPVMCLKFGYYWRSSWPSHLQDFKVLQYLELVHPPELTDLARLNGIPHVRVELDLDAEEDTLLHGAGSWQSLEISSYYGFAISFADTDAFVRSNPK